MFASVKKLAKCCLLAGIGLALNIGVAAEPKQLSPYLNEVTVTLVSLPVTYLPMDILDSYTFTVTKYLFRPLFFDNGSEFSSDVFEKWSVSKSNLEYDFTVKQGLKFHNNSEITAKDVVFTLEAVLREKKGAISYVKNIVSITSPSKYRVFVKLSKPCAYLVPAMADQSQFLVPDNYGGLSKEAFAKAPIGSGNYRLVSATPAEVVIERFTNINGVKKIRFLKASAEETVSLFKQGKVTDPNSVLFSEENLLIKEGESANYTSEELPLLDTQLVGFNFRKKILQDKEIRGFLFSLFRDPAYNLIITDGLNSTLAGGFVPLGMRGHEAREQSYEIERLKTLQKTYSVLLKKWHGLDLELKTRFTKVQLAKIGEWLKVALRNFPKVKLAVTTHTNDELFGSVVKGDFELFSVSWSADFTHPLFFTNAFLSDSKLNLFGVNDKNYDKYFAEYETITRTDDSTFFKKIDNYINENYLVIPISYRRKKYFFPANITGYKLNLQGPMQTDLSEVRLKEN